MATKYQFITDVYKSTINKVTDNPAAWTAFLRSACRNYKCRFDEQILIYAQRPDATAVLDFDIIRSDFGRLLSTLTVIADAKPGKLFIPPPKITDFMLPERKEGA